MHRASICGCGRINGGGRKARVFPPGGVDVEDSVGGGGGRDHWICSEGSSASERTSNGDLWGIQKGLIRCGKGLAGYRSAERRLKLA